MPPDGLTRGNVASFQATLLDLLAQDLPVEVLAKRLNADDAFTEFRAYVGSFEPRMLEVAAALVKKWGKRMPGAAPRSDHPE